MFAQVPGLSFSAPATSARGLGLAPVENGSYDPGWLCGACRVAAGGG